MDILIELNPSSLLLSNNGYNLFLARIICRYISLIKIGCIKIFSHLFFNKKIFLFVFYKVDIFLFPDSLYA
jgi:hypothetical protein